MRIAIIGYGKMGKEVERLAREKGHEIAGIINNNHDTWPEADVAIEFSTPKTFIDNLTKALDRKIPLVSGTTGWYERLDEVKNMVKEKEGSFLYASNFSIGVNLFFQLNEYLSSLMNNYSEYIPLVEEIHHLEKKDSPSGTAITLSNDIIANLDSKTQWTNKISEDTNCLPILSSREPNVPGTHIITYASEVDSLQIKHVANNRQGFALGAIFAAEWLKNKNGFFTMKDLLK